MLISSDSHVLEVPSTLDEYCSPKFRSHAPRTVLLPSGEAAIAVDGSPRVLAISEVSGSKSSAHVGDVPKAAYEPESRISYMVDAGVAAEVLFPTVGLLVSQHISEWYRSEFAFAYNRWMYEQWNDRRFGRLLILPESNFQPSILEKAASGAQAAGFAGVLLPLVPPTEYWSAKRYSYVFEILDEHCLVAAFHAFYGSPVTRISYAARSYVGAAIDAIGLAVELLQANILDKNLNLQVLIAEGGEWWLNPWLTEARGSGLLRDSARGRLAFTSGSRDYFSDFVLWGNDYPHGWAGKTHRTDLGAVTKDLFWAGSRPVWPS